MSPDEMLEKIKKDITVDISWDDHTESLSIDVETENSVVSFELWSSLKWRLQKLKLSDLEKHAAHLEIIKLIQELRNVADDLEAKTNSVINQESSGVITSVALGDPESIKLRPRRKYKKFSP